MADSAADVPGLRGIRGCRTVTAEGEQWQSHGPPPWVPSVAPGRCKTGARVVEPAIYTAGGRHSDLTTPARRNGTRLRRQAVHPRLRPPRVLPEEEVRDR